MRSSLLILCGLLVIGSLAANVCAQTYPSVSYTYGTYGRCTSITNEKGQKTSLIYDDYGRCTSYTEPLNAPGWNGSGTVANRTWSWSYERNVEGVGVRDASAHTAREWGSMTEPAFDTLGDQRGATRTWDVNNRMLSETTGLINGAAGADTEAHRYAYDEAGNKKSYTDPRGRFFQYTFDNRERPYQTIAPKRTDETGNPTTTTLYDFVGNKSQVTFPDGKTQHWDNYNAFGQARQFTDERGDLTDLTYQWGPMKKLASVTTHRVKDGGGTEDQLTQFFYDGTGRPTKTIFPDLTTEISTYDSEQLASFKTRRNQTKNPSYDVRGREIGSTWVNNAAPAITRSWDDAGRLLSISNVYAALDFGYDAAGQITYEGDTVAGTTRTQTSYYRYPDGRAAHIVYPSGFSARMDYTARGQMKAAGWDNTSGTWVQKAINYVYFDDGKVNYQVGGDQVKTAFTYDARGLPNTLNTFQVAGSKTLTNRTYTHDSRDRILSAVKSTSNTLNALENGKGDYFGYDAEGQLVSGYYDATDASGTGYARKDSFAYDALGNRQGTGNVAGQGAVTFTRRDNGLNQYLTWSLVGSGSYLHDDQAPYGSGVGNGVLMTEGTITAASYNALNQPVYLSTSALSPNYIWFGYDPLGRCVKRWTGPSTASDPATNPGTYFTYDSGWNLLQEGSSATSVARSYIHGDRTDEIVASSPNIGAGLWYYHHYDARGHCIMLTDAAGNLLEQYAYDAFGTAYPYNAAGAALTDTQLVGNRFLFTGREWLKDLKLYDFRNRLYQPLLGRFMQPDPKQFGAGDYNLYRYAHNDPINHSDPTGLFRVDENGILQPETTKEFIQMGNAIENGNTMDTTPLISPIDIVSGGIAGLARGLSEGVASGATKEVATQVLSSGSKAAAMDAAKSSSLPRAVITAIQRATKESDVIVSRTGNTSVVTATRMGENGAQTMVTVVKPDGTKTVVQIAVDKAMKFDHVELKK